jgi:AcrR family transcriptional regulator
MLHVMTSPVPAVSLRDQHAALTRERILTAVADLLEEDVAEEITVPDVAQAAGVSLRTVYRYYPTRDELLEAAGRWIGDELLKHPYPEDLDGVADLYEAGCRDFDKRPGLVRALALSQLGQEMRGYRRRERVEAIRRVLRTELPDLNEAELRRAGAVLAYLHNMLAYTSLREESGLSGEEIGAAVGWAIRTLSENLRRKNNESTRIK